MVLFFYTTLSNILTAPSSYTFQFSILLTMIKQKCEETMKFVFNLIKGLLFLLNSAKLLLSPIGGYERRFL